MKITKPFTGLVAFAVILFSMPLGHAFMILMEKSFGHDHIYFAALFLGFLGLFMLILGVISSSESKATLLGFFGGLFIWTGWIEFAYVYYASRYGVAPLISNGEIVTKPEYLIMPSSIGFWAVMMIYYFFGTKTGCKFFNWLQKKLKFSNVTDLKPAKRNITMTIFLELIALLWTFYLVLLFLYDKNFVGEKHLLTYIVAFGSLFWSLYLFSKLIKITKTTYAVKYALPTVIIFWNFVEILGRWGFFKEIWIEPGKYWIEMVLILSVFIILVFVASFEKRKNRTP